MLADTAGINLPIAGFVEAARASGRSFAPLVWANASPSAEVEEEAFERIAGMMVDDLRGAGPVDAVYLDLHGAMVAEHLEDGEGELLRRTRDIIGPDIPLVASLDLHANISPLMADRADALVVFRTYPHVDMAKTGARTARLLERIFAEGRPAKRSGRFPSSFPSRRNAHSSNRQRAFMRASRSGSGARSRRCRSRAASRSPTRRIAGPPHSPMRATNAAPQRPQTRWPTRCSARGGASTAASCRPKRRSRVQTAPGGPAGRSSSRTVATIRAAGADGDTTGLLRALAAARPQGAVLGLLIDPEAAEAAHGAGVGARLPLALGGHSGIPGDGPFETEAVVRRLGSGAFTCTGPFYGGSRMQLGPMALLELPGGVQVAIASRKVQAADREMFRHLGVEPADCRILALKSSVHFRADFGPIAGEVLIAAAPGPVAADPGVLTFSRLRPGVAQRL